MAGRHFKGDGADVSRQQGSPVNNGVPRQPADPGETAMFVALHEQSKRASSVATSGRAKIPAGGPKPQRIETELPGGASRPSGSGATPLPKVNRTSAPQPRGDEGESAELPPVDSSSTGALPAFAESDTQFQGSGAKEDFYDFNLPYGGSGENAGVTGDGLVRHRHRKGRKQRKAIAVAVVAVLLVLVVAGGAGGFMMLRSAKNVEGKAREAVTLVTGLKDKLTSGDFAALPDDAAKINDLCSDIQAETDSPLWQAASFVPVVGGDVSAARTIVSALSDVSEGGLVPMAAQLASASSGKLIQAGGIVNVSALQAVANSLSDTSEVFESANDRVQAIGDTHIAKVTELVDTAKNGFGMLDGAVNAAKKVAPVLPQMLGANGQTRNYLMIAENNVEIRSRGGFGGSQGVISVTDGQMSVGDFKPALNIGDENALPITDEEQTLFNYITQHMGTNSGDALYTPDFPRAASLDAQMWEIGYDQHIDGVIATDPVFLQYLLGLVGGVTLPDGTAVDGTNAAKVLMHDVYWNYPVSESDGIFASVASAAFDKIMNGMGDMDLVNLVSVFEKGCEQGRFIAWMQNDDEEAALKEMGIAAALPSADDTSADPVAGVFVNNYSYSKIDWYLDLDTQVGVGTKAGDGSMTYQVTATLKNTLKASETDSIPDYVASSMLQADGVTRDRGNERLGVYLYAPAGGTISDVKVQGSDLSLTAATHNGLDVQYGLVNLMPEETCTITYTVTTSKDAGDKPLTVQATPTCQAARSNE